MSQIHYTTYSLDTGSNPVAATSDFDQFATSSLCTGVKVELTSEIVGYSPVAITMDAYRTVTEGEIKAEHARYGPLGGRIHPVLPEKCIGSVKDQTGSPVWYVW